VGRTQNFVNIKLVVHIVTTGLSIIGTTNLELQLVGNYVLRVHLYSKVKGKGKARPMQGMKAQRGSRGVAVRFL
jgi:hypothetical protein